MIFLLIGYLQTDGGQNWLARQVTKKLSRDLQSRISIDRVRIGFFNEMDLEGVLIEDQKQDTLLWAGTMEVRITDWFFLKDKVDLKYIGLKDAVINVNRTDSTWNYQFLQDYFSTPSGNKKESGIELNLKKVEMDNVAFTQKDAWLGSDMYVKAGIVDVDANNISITQKNVDINDLLLTDASFHSFSYQGNKPKSSVVAITSNNSFGLNPDNWKVNVNNISINNARYRSDAGTLTTSSKFFDGKHLDFTAINGSIKQVIVSGDTVRANIDLTTKERSGLVVKSLKTNLRLHPQLMEFDKLHLETNSSVLGNYFSMKYDDISSLGDFISAVNLEANFLNTNVSTDDIAFFAPEIINWNKNIQLKGKVTGTVDDLAGHNVVIGAGNNSSLIGDFSLVGLPDINSTFIHVKADELRTTYADAIVFAPALKKVTTPNLRKLSYLKFRGNYTGFINDFVTYGTLQTALGTLVTDINMKLPQGAEPVYSGSLSTQNFQLGQFLNNNELGLISFKGNVKGRSFDWNKLDMNIDGKVDKIYYNNYTYQNIIAKGRLKNKTFDGNFVINDPNADLKLTGLIDLSGSSAQFDVRAAISHLNLKALGLTDDAFTFNGDFDLNLTGNSLTDFVGSAQIQNATLLQGDKRLSFDSLIVTSNFIDGVRNLHARSNEFDATVTGNFNLNTLPDAFTLFLHRYYPSYIKPPRRTVATNQSFTFDITTGVIEDYIKIIDPRLSGFNNSKISGSLNVASNSFILNANIPHFAFNQYEFTDVKINGDGNFERLIVAGELGNTTISDTFNLPQTTFRIQAQNDVSDISINTTANQTINKADLTAQVKTFSNGISILFNPSSFVLNGKTWTIEQGGELDFRKNSIFHGELVLKESTQEIRLSTQPSGIGNWNDLHVALKNLNIGDISPMFIKTNRIEGLLSGDIVIEDPENKFNVVSSLRTDLLRVDNDSLGQVQANITYNNLSGALKGRGENLNPAEKIFFEFDLDLKDTANLHRDRISVQPINYPVKILERFLGGLFSNMEGYLTGKLDILGEGANRDYVGKGKLTDASLKVNFTQVNYKIDDTEIELTENSINLGRLKLRDKNGNTATVEGKILHNSFKNMYFDIYARVDDSPMQLINTNYKDNQDFYGRANGTGTMSLTGPQYDMQMRIKIEASDEPGDSSYVTLPPSRTRESGLANFMVEKKYGREMTEDELRGSPTNISYDVDLTANPNVNIDVVLDEVVGDVIKGRGTGNIFLRGGTSEPLSIRGRYNIQEGSYVYTFQSIFKKPFVINPGSTNYIEWTGDPYTATIHLEAVYTAEGVSFAPLVTGLISSSTSLARHRGDVNVVATLSGELFRPSFNFKLEFPQDLYRNIDQTTAFSLQQGIQQIERNINEINRQVTYLIVFNSFAPYENTQNTAYRPLDELAYNTISGLLFGEINKRLNQLLSSILLNNELTVNFTGSLYNRNILEQGFQINQSNLNISIGKSLFNERVILTLGGTFDVPIQSDIQQNIQLFPDVTVQFLINKSGSVRATVFYQESPYIQSGIGAFRSQRAGANVSYRKEFESLSSFLFGRKKANAKVIPLSDSTKVIDSSAVGN